MLAYMGDRYDVELEPEVRQWLDTLSLIDYRTVEYHADRLAEAPTTLGEPYSEHLQGRGTRTALPPGPRRVAGHLLAGAGPADRAADRVPQDPGPPAREVERAVAAQWTCEQRHQPATHIYDREG